MPVGMLSDDERKTVAAELGYKTIGKELPDSVTLTEIVKSMPPEVRASAPAAAAVAPTCACLASRAHRQSCLLLRLQVFELDHGKAWRAVLTTLASVAATLYLVHVSPWYLLPFAWALAGTAFTGVSSFAKSNWSS